jgi:hypothetical protein
MKIGITSSPTVASETLEKSTMGMSAKGMDIAAYFLRDKIYNDKVLACVREYICNAVDEHKKYKIERPIVVFINTIKSTKTWSVRDYAKGLDERGIRNIFGMYFESTKNHSNEYTGGFGIGSKSAHSYTDTFYINSHHNGTCSMYVCVLGGGDKGVPIGEIFKISEEPSFESGIEISFDVTDDYNNFFNTTKTFVESFDNNFKIEFYKDDDLICTPNMPINSIDLEEYKMHQYVRPNFDYFTNQIKLRMGGVVYKTLNFPSSGFHNNKQYVVDVPIGKLTIPISRENIEDTPNNKKVINEILVHIQNFKTKQIEKLKPLPFGEYVQSSKSEMFSDDWFNYSMFEYIPDTYTALNSTIYYEVTSRSDIQRDSNDKLPIYKFPNLKSLKNWKLRLAKYLKSIGDYKGYAYTINDQSFNVVSDKINTSDIEIIDIKKMKLPKLDKNTSLKKYNIFKGGAKIGSFTSEEFETYVNEIFGDIDDNWHETIEDLAHLQYRTIAHCDDYYSRRSDDCLYTNSKTLLKELHELGWLTPSLTEHQNATNRIQKIKDFKKKQSYVEYDLKSIISFSSYAYNPRLIKCLKKNPLKIDRIKTVVAKIKAEDTTRGRILNTLSKFGSNVHREDLRKVLLIKN